MPTLQTKHYTLNILENGAFLTYSGTQGKEYALSGPVFEVNGAPLLPEFSAAACVSKQTLSAVLQEYSYALSYKNAPGLTLTLVLRVAEESPVVRFGYRLSGKDYQLTKQAGQDCLTYFSLPVKEDDALTEVRFSEFNQLTHSFCMNEVPVEESFFANSFFISVIRS